MTRPAWPEAKRPKVKNEKNSRTYRISACSMIYSFDLYNYVVQ